MKKDDMIVLALAGGAALLVAKAAGLSFPSLSGLVGGAQTFQQSIWRPLSPFAGTSYDPVDPGDYVWNNSLIAGSIHDYYSGDVSSYGTPTVQSLFGDVLNETYGTKPKSVVMVDGIWW